MYRETEIFDDYGLEKLIKENRSSVIKSNRLKERSQSIIKEHFLNF